GGAMSRLPTHRWLGFLISVMTIGSLAGPSPVAGQATPPPSSNVPAVVAPLSAEATVTISGRVLNGVTPVASATVQVACTTANGSSCPATSPSPVITNGTGNFSFTGQS